MNLEEAVKICLEWFKEYGISIPRTAREWAKGNSGVHIPPGMTYQTLRRKGISVGDLLERLSPEYTNRIKNKEGDLSFLHTLGLEFKRLENTELIVFICKNCGEEHSALKGTLRRWEASSKKYCSNCRKAAGKIKSLEYYSTFLKGSEYVVKEKKGNNLLIEHTSCNRTFYRSRGYITSGLDDGGLKCPHCYSGPYFIHNKGAYTSQIEKTLTEYLVSIYPYPIQREILYSQILPTNRMYRLDLWLPTDSVGIEITSPGNNLPEYQTNLTNKLELAQAHKIKIYKATSKKDIEDIVRTLLKDKEISPPS